VTLLCYLTQKERRPEMIIADTEIVLYDREYAGRRLARKLAPYKGTDAVVVGIPQGGVCVASALAQELGLPLEVMLCRKLKHPGDFRTDIGSVGEDEVYIHDCPRGVPQDYLFHTILSLRNDIKRDDEFYHAGCGHIQLSGKVVILADDIVKSCDSIMACLRSIRKHHPSKLVVAIPVIGATSLNVLSKESDDLFFLTTMPEHEATEEYFMRFPKVGRRTVRGLLRRSRNEIRCV